MIKRMLRLNDNVRCFLLVFLFLICKNNNVEFGLSAGIYALAMLEKNARASEREPLARVWMPDANRW